MGLSGRIGYILEYIALFETEYAGFRHVLKNVESPVTGSQRTPGFWGFTAWYQSLGIRIPRELGFGYPSPLGVV